MSVLVGKEAPNFKAKCAQDNTCKTIELKDYRGKYVILFFYPLDFTFVCPTELHAFQDRLADFSKNNCVVLGCSVDSYFSHNAWLNTPKEKGGIKGVTYGLIADLGGYIAKDYDVLSDEEVAYRGLFLIDRDGIVRHQVVNDLPLGRNVEEALRMLVALQHTEEHGEVCPANWMKGKNAMTPTDEGVAEYLVANG
ncbi:MAG: peroxiredoxin [Alphaproteobacteria bacterium]|nr:peroxiredoxin [Alphaproteobacteria bacterium]